MGKLTNLPMSLGTLRSSVAYMPQGEREQDKHRDTQSWRRWYKTTQWRRLRWSILVRDHFTCQMPGCGRTEGNTSLLVADHKKPHRGNETLFWDETNLECICKPCHDGAKQRQEQGR